MSYHPTDRSLSSPFIKPDGMMMSEVLNKLDTVVVSEIQRRDLKSAIRSVCRLIDRAPTEVPANINWVHVRMRRVHPAQDGISEKRLKNIRAGVLKALELCNASRDRADWLRPPSPAWEALLNTVPNKHDVWKLTQLAQYCTALGVLPQDIRDDHVRDLLTILEQETFVNLPCSKVGSIISVWNRLRGDLPGWPAILLSYPRKREPWTFPIERFPESFQRDVARWLDRLGNPDPLNGEGPAKPARPATIFHRRFQVQQIASAIVQGGVPISEMRDLGCLVDLERLKLGLRYMMNRFGGKSTEAIHAIAVSVKSMARYHVKVEGAHLTELAALCKRLSLKGDGPRAKNQARLEQLDDEDNLALLLCLPAHLQRAAKRPNLTAQKRALLIQAALCIEILLHAPMRIGNLSRLSLDRHIRRARVKGADCLLLSIPGAEVKNGRDLSFELTTDAVALFDLYMAEHRAVLLLAPSEYLFPAQNGGAKAPTGLSTLIKTTIHAHTGLTVNAHLFRSIAGKIHCMIHPGDFLTLGHAIGDSLRTTMKSYAQFEQKNAVRHFQASVTEARRRLTDGKRNYG